MASVNNEASMAETMDYCSGEVMRAIIFVVRSNGGEASFDKVASEFSSSAEYPEGITYNPREFLEYIVENKSAVFETYSIVNTDGVFKVYWWSFSWTKIFLNFEGLVVDV